jgi:hypothetical protein
MGCDARDDDVERAVGEREVLGARDDVGPHPRGRVDRDHRLAAGLLQPPRDVAAARGDVERLHARPGLTPLDHEVEVRAFTVRRAVPKRLRALRPHVAHAAAANSTAR